MNLHHNKNYMNLVFKNPISKIVLKLSEFMTFMKNEKRSMKKSLVCIKFS